MQNNCDDDDNDVVYKDIVIVGNGPSGISLSYMLAGNWPYYTGEPHPFDEMLTARLHYTTRPFTNDEDILEKSDKTAQNNLDEDTCSRRQSNVANDGVIRGRDLAHSSRWKLETLSSGLEGRSGGRPLSLLMDQLQNPCVDAGLDVPSLLDWKSKEQHPEHKIIDHVVLGKGQPGGAWQSMDPNVLTISLSRWMSLPGLDLRQWEKLVEAEQVQKSTLAIGDPSSHSPREKINACKPASRVPVGTVATYYRDYVIKQGLDKYFRCGTIVTSVRPIDTIDVNEDFRWIVEGYANKTGKRFEYRCRRVVLATGTTDLSNHLGIPGERSQSSWVIHDLNDLESRLDQLVNVYGEAAFDGLLDPVLVIGAGLSAADAIMATRFRGIPVLHVFRDASNDWNKESNDKIQTNNLDKLQWLPSSIYPEYHKVYEMMADGGTNYPLYKSLSGYSLADLNINNDDRNSNQCNKHTVTLCAPNGQLQKFRVSIVAILIGYKPDLSYLENNGIGFGKIPDRPVDCKSNPIDVDDITYEVLQAPKKGLYALGPLVGDNFVRFILGGAFGILAHILNLSS
ncbi:PREDICTED: oxidative stress-induced growth inhibitor 2-like isoform X1 [Polistes canadensis]|uniref:oxidative stress-induced growth inhibitor 2-like isoform X1 n=2 Tax=Polistes canadensis TaxID=91411 RepID=UPI000718DAD5|nr:PREDICTED: oxidative stress-induced growth inhibitor 2-like isoform X1 [Polistes canadensis]XP_014606026.1 PREDICTED: oxidative stress-induced growth inhibitor 2-like isoform X1 [Polistes canadensis]XP_014606027.1 PREDICTED: oxidative stress-induced growth inhibitor 2-like isoform X1 [Polistes canadensis]XP_014606029.1 PREDICTED: oxidative stress-induced growth inhibitor 2-like isoform X1 [Polistes canadensis]